MQQPRSDANDINILENRCKVAWRCINMKVLKIYHTMVPSWWKDTWLHPNASVVATIKICFPYIMCSISNYNIWNYIHKNVNRGTICFLFEVMWLKQCFCMGIFKNGVAEPLFGPLYLAWTSLFLEREYSFEEPKEHFVCVWFMSIYMWVAQ